MTETPADDRIAGGAATPSARSTDEAPCPFCGGPTTCCLVFCDGHVFETYRCVDHGDVVINHGEAMR